MDDEDRTPVNWPTAIMGIVFFLCVTFVVSLLIYANDIQ